MGHMRVKERIVMTTSSYGEVTRQQLFNTDDGEREAGTRLEQKSSALQMCYTRGHLRSFSWLPHSSHPQPFSRALFSTSRCPPAV